MKRIDFTGWKDVYLFTLLQTCKNKAFIITVTFMCIVSCAVFPVLGFFLEDNSVEEIIDVEMNQEENATNDYETEKLSGIRNAFFYYDDTDEWLANIFNDTEGTNPYHLQKVEQEFIEDTGLELEDKSDCIFIIKEEDKAYRVEIITNWDVLDISEEIDCIAAWIASEINEAKRLSYSNIEYIEDNSPMICSYIDEKEQDNSALLNMTGYGIQLAFITILTLFIAFSGEGIATSVATEKSGKIVEYLMTSVRPMALVIGKVLAILTTVFFQLAAVTICAFVSGMIVGISSPDVWTRLTDGITNTVVFAGEIHQGTILQLIISILLVIGGFLFFAL